jgi:hypothetical protein
VSGKFDKIHGGVPLAVRIMNLLTSSKDNITSVDTRKIMFPNRCIPSTDAPSYGIASVVRAG